MKETICSSSTGKSLLLFSPQPFPAPSFYSSAPFVPARFYFHGPSASEVHHPAQEHGRKVSLGLLEKAKEIRAGRGVTAETTKEAGDLKEAICNKVQKYEIDLLIMGCEDYRFLKRLHLQLHQTSSIGNEIATTSPAMEKEVEEFAATLSAT